MALRETTVRVAFAGGIETKADSKAIPTTRLLALENATFTKAVSLSKAKGYDALSSDVLGSLTGYSNVRGLGARGSELVLCAEGTSYSYIEGASAWSQIPDGVMSIRQSDEALVKTISGQTTCDYAACDGIALVCWDDSRGGVYYAVTESDGGRVIVSPRQASSTGSRPRAVRCGDDKLHLLWAEAALGQIQIIVIDTNAPHSPSAAAVLTDGLVVALPNFDAAFVSSANAATKSAACICWNAYDGIHVAWLTPAGTIGSVGQGYPSPATITSEAIYGGTVSGPVISPSVENSYAWAIGWVRNQAPFNPHVSLATSDYGTPGTPISCVAAQGIANAGSDYVAIALRDYTAGTSATIDVWAEVREATVRNSNVSHFIADPIALTVAFGTPTTLRGCVLGSSAFVDIVDGTPRSYVTVLHPLPLQAMYLTVRDDGLVVAQSVPSNAGDPPTHRLPRVNDTDGDRVYEWAAVYKAKLDAINDDQFTEAGPRLVSLDFDADDAYQTAYVGRTLYMGGAVTMAYDGITWVESQPLYAPDWESGAVLHTNSNTASGAILNGTYSYLFWYEWTLANGEIVRGPTSKPYSVTTAGADDTVTFTIPTLRLGAFGRSGGSRENCRIGVARSRAGDTSTYYRISSLDPSTAGGDNGYVTNSQAADTASFRDVVSDTNMLLRGDPHYTTGGVPSNDALATSGVIAEGKGRLFLASSSNPDLIYHSQERAEGYAIELTPELAIGVPPGGGPITGIVVMDDAVLIFKRSAIYRVNGPGPLANPSAGGGWTTPVQVTSDVGCLDQRTLVMTPAGIMFQSAKGIYLLDTARGVSYVGAAVEAYNAQTIVRATVIEDSTQVRFLTSSGSTLLYDYLFGQWSTFTNHEGLDAVNINGVYHYLRNDGRVFKQADSYASANLPIPMVIETAWVRLGEARQGFQRIWHLQLLGTWKSPHTLWVQYKTDYKDGADWSAPVAFDATSMGGDDYGDGAYGDGNYGGDSPEPYEWKVHLGVKCEAIQLRFSFVEAYSASADYGACAELTEMLITGGVKAALNKLPAARMG